jgi:hypothetical protein
MFGSVCDIQENGVCVCRNGGRVIRKAVHTFHEKSWYVFSFPLFVYLPVIPYAMMFEIQTC